MKRITTNRVVITLENSTDMSRATRAVRPGSVEHGWKRAEDYERGARWKLC